MNEHETSADIIADMRTKAECAKPYDDGIVMMLTDYADRLKAALKREAQSIERIVRDAVIDYSEMYQSAPNDEAERDLMERAARANAWLKQHGFEEEPVIWSKEETPCL